MRRAIVLALLLLAGCDRAEKIAKYGPADGKVCLTPPPVQTATPVTTADYERAADGCLHRWAYRLAAESEPSEAVAEAVVGGCQDPVFRWAASELRDRGQTDLSSFNSPFTGGRSDPVGLRVEQKTRLARFYVVQARAGHCATP